MLTKIHDVIWCHWTIIYSKKMHIKLSSVKFDAFCSGLNYVKQMIILQVITCRGRMAPLSIPPTSPHRWTLLFKPATEHQTTATNLVNRSWLDLHARLGRKWQTVKDASGWNPSCLVAALVQWRKIMWLKMHQNQVRELWKHFSLSKSPHLSQIYLLQFCI